MVVPFKLLTLTSTTPATFGGVIAVRVLMFTNVVAAEIPPKRAVASAVKKNPERVTVSPPSGDPDVGAMVTRVGGVS